MIAARLAVLVAASRTALALKPLASPVVIGGNNGAVTAALYGKLQRMESVFDSGLGRPALVGSERLVRQTDKILWRAYSMASVTPGDVVPKVDFIKFRGLLGSAAPLYFVDSTGFKPAASQEKGLFDGLPNPFAGKPSSGKPKPKKPAPGGNLKLPSLPNPFGGGGGGNPLEALLPPNRNENFMGAEPVTKSAPVPPPPSTKPGAPVFGLVLAALVSPAPAFSFYEAPAWKAGENDGLREETDDIPEPVRKDSAPESDPSVELRHDEGGPDLAEVRHDKEPSKVAFNEVRTEQWIEQLEARLKKVLQAVIRRPSGDQQVNSTKSS